jgi:hypothetical protein
MKNETKKALFDLCNDSYDKGIVDAFENIIDALKLSPPDLTGWTTSTLITFLEELKVKSIEINANARTKYKFGERL